MCGVKSISFALWITFVCAITGQNDSKPELTLELNTTIHVGEDLELTCRMNYCPVKVHFTWTTPDDSSFRGNYTSYQNVSRLLIRNISVKDSHKVVCKALCQKDKKEKTAKIQMFSFPEAPILPKIKSLIANQTQKLICTVHNIYPPEKFQIQWLRGNKIINTDCPNVANPDHVQNYSSVFNYTPSVDDLGKNISCKAILNLTKRFHQERTTTAEYGPGTIRFSSNNTMVKIGERLEIACHADGSPEPTISWSKLGETEPEPSLSQNHKLIISNASWSQAGWYLCNASNGVGSQQTKIKVIVVGPPNIPKIQLSQKEEPKEGENISIVCSSGGRPAELKLYKQSQSTATGDPNKSTVMLNISIQVTDAGIYICEAKNEFGIERSTINITVQAAQEDTWSKPDLPVVIVPTVGSVSLLTAAGLLIRHCRKKAQSDSSNISLS